MTSAFDDGDGIRKAREKFISDVQIRDPFPHDRPAKLFIDVLFAALNTGATKDIQVCETEALHRQILASGPLTLSA